MTSKQSKDIASLLKTLKAPTPGENLKTRILEEAKNPKTTFRAEVPQAANDNKWKWVSSIAAIFIATLTFTASFWFEPISSSETPDLWAEAAISIGYGDLYEWVYDTEIEDSL